MSAAEDEIVSIPLKPSRVRDWQARPPAGDRHRDSEVMSTPLDKTLNGLPRHVSGRAAGRDLKPPALWAAREALQFPEAVGGQYPKGFLDYLARVLGADRHRILHLCSGSLLPGEGIRVDRRAAAAPDVLADARRLPFADDSFDAVAIDPPYSVEYARDLYGTEYPLPSHLVAEASRVVRGDGRVSLLHFLVPASPPELEFETVYGVTTGVGYRIRALTVWRKRGADLFA